MDKSQSVTNHKGITPNQMNRGETSVGVGD